MIPSKRSRIFRNVNILQFNISIFVNLTSVKFREFWHVHIWNIHGIYRIHTIFNDCSLNRHIFGTERIEMGANKYRKGIWDWFTELAEEFRITESDARWDQDQDSLLVKRRNDNHSPGAGEALGGEDICLVMEFSVCLLWVGWEWGSSRIG